MSEPQFRAQEMTPQAATQAVPALLLHDIARTFGSGAETLEIFRGVTAQIMPEYSNGATKFASAEP